MYHARRALTGTPPLYSSHHRTLFSLARHGNSSNNTYKVTRLVSCSPHDMFNIVSDVQRYKEFVPFVTDSFINKIASDGLPTEAGLRVGWNLFDEKFTCSLECVPGQKVIARSESDSLFEHLSTQWTFAPKKGLIKALGDLCSVELTLDYRFHNPLYNSISTAFSRQVTSIMIAAFEDRVKQLSFGRRSITHKDLQLDDK